MTDYFVRGAKLPDEDGDIALASDYAYSQMGSAGAGRVRAQYGQVLYRVTPVDAATDGEQVLEGVWIVTDDPHVHVFRTELEALRYAYPLEGFIEVSFKSFEETGS